MDADAGERVVRASVGDEISEGDRRTDRQGRTGRGRVRVGAVHELGQPEVATPSVRDDPDDGLAACGRRDRLTAKRPGEGRGARLRPALDVIRPLVDPGFARVEDAIVVGVAADQGWVEVVTRVGRGRVVVGDDRVDQAELAGHGQRVVEDRERPCSRAGGNVADRVKVTEPAVGVPSGAGRSLATVNRPPTRPPKTIVDPWPDPRPPRRVLVAVDEDPPARDDLGPRRGGDVVADPQDDVGRRPDAGTEVAGQELVDGAAERGSPWSRIAVPSAAGRDRRWSVRARERDRSPGRSVRRARRGTTRPGHAAHHRSRSRRPTGAVDEDLAGPRTGRAGVEDSGAVDPPPRRRRTPPGRSGRR